MIRKSFSLFRCSTATINTRADKARLQEKIQNDRIRVLKNYRYNLSNRRHILDNFKENKNDPVYLDKCEIETRIMKRLHDSELVNLKTFSFNQDLRQDLKLDSLNVVVLIT
jgi:hypothetical protein